MLKELTDQEFWQMMLDRALGWAIEVLPILIFIFILFLISKRMIRFILNRVQKNMHARYEREANVEMEKRVNTLIGIIKGTLIVGLWLFFILITLREIGLDIAPLLAGAGIVGLAVGFGAQELVRDVISGFFILLENQIRTGDVAIIDGTGGLVEKIELRTVTLRDLSGVVHVFQNGKISKLSNMTKEWSAMVFDIGVAYKEDVARVEQLIAETAAELQNDPELGQHILEPIEVLGLDQFGDSAVVVKARLKTKPGQQWMIGRAYRKRLKKVFDEQRVEIPFPHRTIYWGEEISPLRMEVDEQPRKSA